MFLAKLPKGLGDLALQRRLSFAVVQLLEGIADWDVEIDDQLQDQSDVPQSFRAYDARLVERCKRLLVHAELMNTEKVLCSATMAYATTLGKEQRNEVLFGWYKIHLAIGAEQVLEAHFHRPDEIACLQWVALVIATPIDEPPLEVSNPRIILSDTIIRKHDRAREWKLLPRDGLRLFWDEDSEPKSLLCLEVAMRRRVDGIVKKDLHEV